MARLMSVIIFVIIAIQAYTCPVFGEDITDADVKKAIDAGVKYVLGKQQANGSWIEGQNRPGMTALVVLALVNCDVDRKSKEVQAGAEFLNNAPLNMTYDVGLIAMALSEVDPVKYKDKIKKCADWLMEGMGDGVWTYGQQRPGRGGVRRRSGDNSNTQYAVLGLRAAEEAGVKIPDEVWKKIMTYFQTTQNEDGSWAYAGKGNGYGSMTTAGLGSIFIAGGKLHQTTDICGKHLEDPHIIKAIQWLGTNFSVKTNPKSGGWAMYYLYGLERCGVLSAMKYFGAHDWYREGAEFLVSAQRPDGTWVHGTAPTLVKTCFALLFLGKGKVPILFNKLRYEGNWNNNPDDVKNVCIKAAEVLNVQCTYQIVNLEGKVEDLLSAPCLYFNGHECRDFTEAEIAKLQKYLYNGGFLFVEACCGKKDFDTKFRELAKKLLPDYKLEKLPAEHPLYSSHYKLDPAKVDFWGINTGCKRLSVLYSPKPLSYHWQGRKGADEALKVGVNIAAFLMQNRPLAGKLEKVKVVDEADKEKIEPGAFVLQVLEHEGGFNPIPAATTKWMALLREKVSLRVALNTVKVKPNDNLLFKYDFTYMVGHSKFKYTKEEIEGLRKYLKEGGFLFAEACSGLEEFDKAFREMVKELFPDKKLELLDEKHPIISGKSGYDIRNVEYTAAVKREAPDLHSPYLEAIIIDGKIVLLYSKYGIGSSIANQNYPGSKSYVSKDAIKLAVNVVIFAMNN